MAFTSAPINQTYSTQNIPVAFNLDFRQSIQLAGPSTRADAGTINLVPRMGSNKEVHMESRAPLLLTDVVATGYAGTTIRGMYVWEYTNGGNIHFVVAGNSVYTSLDSGSTWSNPVNFVTLSDNPVGFTEFINSSNVKSLVLVDGIEGYVFTYSAGLVSTKITDADFPSPHLPFPIFLDGYLFLAKSGTGDIYNSNLNDPATWTAGDFISSEVYPDDLKALIKIDNYLLAIGSQASEYFYDAANTTGSPLSRYDGALLPFGTQLPFTIASTKTTAVVFANNNDGEGSLVVIEGMKYKDITPPWLIEYMQQDITNISASGQYFRIRGNFIRQNGELLFTIRCPNNAATAGDYGFFVYSFKHDLWTEWCGNEYLSFPAQAFAMSTSNSLVTYAAALSFDGTTIYHGTFSTAATSKDNLGGTLYPFPIEIRTNPLTFDTLNKKAMNRLGVEMVSASGSTATTLSIYKNDSDSSWESLGTLTATGTTNFPFITQLGMFRQRQLKIVYTGGSAVRFLKIQVDINKGQQ